MVIVPWWLVRRTTREGYCCGTEEMRHDSYNGSSSHVDYVYDVFLESVDDIRVGRWGDTISESKAASRRLQESHRENYIESDILGQVTDPSGPGGEREWRWCLHVVCECKFECHLNDQVKNHCCLMRINHCLTRFWLPTEEKLPYELLELVKKWESKQ